MIYREYLVMRKALAWFAGIALAIMLINVVLLHKGDARMDHESIAVQSGCFAAIFAWIFGVALGNSSREAAHVLWVLPAKRWKLALQIVGIGLAGATIAFACEYVLSLLFLVLAGLRFKAELVGTLSFADIALALALAYATYGSSALVGMLGRRMPYCGLLAAPALILWMTVAQSQSALGAILRAASVANPFAVFNTALAISSRQHHGSAVDSVSSSLQWLGTTWETPVLLALAIATCGLAVLRWQRAQVIS